MNINYNIKIDVYIIKVIIYKINNYKDIKFVNLIEINKNG
jgi:hypothetical protein